MKFEHATLPNGLQIIAEVNPHALSTAIGFFVRAGSRDEPPELAGVSHFLEHMAFKGSTHRSADDVNRAFDEIGAKYNAYTTEEHTVFHAAVLPEYLQITVDLLGDLLRPSLRTDDFETEKKVILEEISMYADSPMWTAYERAMRVHFLDHPVGNSVLGTEETVGRLTPEQMRAYHHLHYGPNNVFVAAAGNLDWEQLPRWIELKCGDWEHVPVHRSVPRSHQRGRDELLVRDAFVQECLFLLLPAPAADAPLRQRFAAELLSNIIGDETGSRFHWELAEPGKVDSIDFSYHEYEGVGLFIASASCDPDLAEANLEQMRQILHEVTAKGIGADELEQAKNKIGSRVVLAGERPRNRLSSLGYNWSYRKEYRSVADDLYDLNQVAAADIEALLEAYPLRQPTTICLGPRSQMAALSAR